MRLLILHLAQVAGGAERTTSNLLRYLNRTKVQHITLVTSEALRSYFPATYDHFIDASAHGLHYGLSGWRILYADGLRFSEILREQTPDIVLGMMHYASALAVFGARFSSSRAVTIASFRGPFYEYMRHYERGLRRILFLRATVAATALLADRVIVPSVGTKQELQRRFLGRAGKTIVIPNGIDQESAEQAAAEPLPVAYSAPAGHVVLCAVARLAVEKNLHLLLAAFRIVYKTHPVALMIIGDGPERASLEQAVRDWQMSSAVTFVGYQANVYPFLRCADLFIHTCQFEGFGYAILEAMACGTAVIATDCPHGPREIIGANQYGMLVAPDDVQALAGAIRFLLDNAAERDVLAARGLARARMLSISQMVQAYEQVLGGLVSVRQGRT